MSNLPYISEEVIQAYKGILAASPVSTQKRKAASLNKFFAWAEKKGYINGNHVKTLTEAKNNIQTTSNTITSLIPEIRKPSGSKYLSISKLIGVSLVLLVAASAVLLVRNLEIPIPFTFTPASTDTNLVRITDDSGSANPSGASSIAMINTTPSVSPSPSVNPTAIPTNTPTISPSSIPTASPTLVAVQSNSGIIEAEMINISTLTNSDGSITLNPDGAGKLNVILEGASGNLASFLGANLNKGNLIYGYVGNNSTGYDLLRLQSGSKPFDRFLVDALGNTRIGGNLDEVHDVNLMGNLIVNGLPRFTSDGRLNLIRGYYQESGNFDIQQGASEYALIHKTLSDSTGKATTDTLTLELDESQVADSSSRDTVVISRKNGKSDAYALFIPYGNVQLDNNLGIGGNISANGNLNINGNSTFNKDIVIIGSGTTCTIGSGTGATSCTSDERLKTNIKNLGSSLDKINALRPVTFNWIDPLKDQSQKTGLIAQETQQVFPEMVHEIQNGYLGIDYAALTVPLIKAVQELDKKVSNTTSFISQNIATGGLVVHEVAIIEGQFIAENIKAGTIVTKNITTDSFYAFQGKIDSLLVETKLLSPVVQTKLISPLADESDIKFQIGKKNEPGKLAITNANDQEVASISSTGDASFSGKLKSNELAVNGEATVSGTLYADNIIGAGFEQNKEKLNEIEKILKNVQINQDLLAELTKSTDLHGKSVEGDVLASLSVDRFYVTGQAAITSLSVTQSLSLGNDLVFQSNSINTLTTPLSIQSLALAPIEIMAGKIKIDTKGNISIDGNLTANQVNTEELQTDKIIIASNTNEAASESSVDASLIETNATAGVAMITAESTEITIKNPNITDTTLVYVTPTSPTNNQVLYLKSKKVGSFVVGFENPALTDINFNWWVIEVAGGQ